MFSSYLVKHSKLSRLGFYLSLLTVVLLLSQSAFAGSLLISWDPISSSMLAGYKIKLGTTSGSYSQSLSVGKVTSYTLQNLTDGVKYYFVVVGVDGNSIEGMPSIEVSGLVLNSASIAATSITTSSAIVTWTTNKPGSSQIEYGTTTSYGSTTPLDSTLVSNHSQTLTNLNPGTTYNYRIRSVDLGGSVHVSGNSTFTTTAALSSSNVAASSITTSSAVITWTTNRSSSSQVEYGTTTSYGSTTSLDSTLVVNHSQTLTSLNPGTTYNYRIRSIDAGGTSHVSGNLTFTTTAAQTLLAVNVGGGQVAQFGADAGFSGGQAENWGQIPIDITGITNPAPESVYQSERWGTSFSYTFSNLTPGAAYYVRLHFSEHNWTNVGQRRFHVAINGVRVLTDFDILASAGKQDKACIQQFRSVASNGGQIVIQYSQGSVDLPSTNGIELVPASQVNPPVSEINVGGSAVGTFQTDPAGSGGTTTTYSVSDAINTTGVLNAAPQGVYQTERRGSDFTYTVSNLTLNASYLVRLHFAEIYWSSTGQRKFNVSANGVSMLKDFDIVAAAGGANRAVIREFVAVPNSDGAVAIRFTSGSVDLAKASGIQVLPLAPIAAINAGGLARGSFGNDAFYSGGTASTITAVIDTTGVTPSVPASIYGSARTGNFSYTIPNLVPGAVYSVRLHFAETSSSNANKRQFNVFINGVKVLNNFDIVSVAGSLNKAVVQQFAAVADSNGTIALQFSGSKGGSGKVSAIEVLK